MNQNTTITLSPTQTKIALAIGAYLIYRTFKKTLITATLLGIGALYLNDKKLFS